VLGGRLWRHWDFLKLWSGQSISRLGTAVSDLALPTIAVFQLHANPFQVGLLIALQRLAFPMLAPFAGSFIDHNRRRPVMVVSDVARMLTLASIPVASLLGSVTLIQLYLVAIAVSIASVFFDLAYLAYMPGLVSRADLFEGNAKLQVSEAVTETAGPGLAGLLITTIGAARAVAADAFSFLVSVTSLLLIRHPEAAPATGSTESRWQSLTGGARFVFGHPVLRSLILGVGLSIIGSHVIEAVEYPFAYTMLHLTPAAFGLTLSIGGIGSVIGALFAGPIIRRAGVGPTIAVTGALTGVFFGSIALATRLPAIPVFATAFFLTGLVDPIHNVNQQSLRQALTPDRLQGRMNATFRTVYWGAWPLGNLLGGFLGTRYGLVPVIIGGSVSTVLVSLGLLLTPLRRVTEHPTLEETPPT
jgi:MFS family permease